jgi:cyclohexadieny/prephenate dehydrogenase
MTDVIFERLALIGIGLIGSSISLAARRGGLAGEIVCSSRRPETLQAARDLNLADHYFADPAEAVRGADCVILCTPVGAVEVITKAIAPHLADGVILSDVGSVKKAVIEQISPHLPASAHLVPGHPVAGTEQSGPSAGFTTLFDDKWCILTPQQDVDRVAVEKMIAFWRGCGSRVDVMDAAHHDRVLAVTSHLPQLVAYNIVGTVTDLESHLETEVVKYSAGGLRDFTRLAASDPTMWRDVCLTNKDAVLEMLGRFSEDLSSMQRAIRWGDGDALHALFTRTREMRQKIVDAGQEIDVPDFGRNNPDGSP